MDIESFTLFSSSGDSGSGNSDGNGLGCMEILNSFQVSDVNKSGDGYINFLSYDMWT